MYLSESLTDYAQDFNELHYLLKDSINRLGQFLADIKKAKKYISATTYEEIVVTTNHYIEACRTQDHFVSDGSKKIKREPIESTLQLADGIKKSVYEFLRTHQTLFGALITSTDWQSPSFLHSRQSQAGRQTGRIYATMNDYKRDQHWDAHTYEQTFLKQNIDGFIKFPINLYATSSGMAAFTTILNYLLLEKKITRSVLIGKSIYFENKTLLLRAFPNSIIEVDESKTDTIIEAINTHNPSAIFFDSLCNSPDVAVPCLTEITKHLISHSKQETFLVIDNTCLTSTFQPFPLVMGKFTKLRLILFESLNKYHQYGFDRVTGGMIAALGGDTGKLFDYRDKLGTNIPDNTVASIPTPNRVISKKRLLRHERNTALVAARLQQWVDDNPKLAFSAIMYPTLSHHASYRWTTHMSFHGSFFTIQFKKRYQNIPSYKRFVNIVMAQAAKHHVDLVSGTSFGMNITRIYTTATRSKPNTPFVRVAVGTETREAIEAIVIVFLEAFSHFR